MLLRQGSYAKKSSSPIWLIIFSDMSTNLMMFFLLLFAMTRMSAADREQLIEGMEKAMVNKEAIESRRQRQVNEQAAIQSLQNVLAYGRLKEYAKVDVKDDKIKLTIEMPFFFGTGSAELSEQAAAALEGLVEPVAQFPNDIVIEGHTDNVPISGARFASNWELSVARSVSVVDFFVKRGVDHEKLIVGGYGEFHPAYPNDSDEHRALNRRIEITIIRSQG